MSRRAFLAVGLALLVSALLPVVAGAGPYKVKNLQAISAGPSLFPAGCPGAFHDSEKPTGLETEPAITVNPANPRNIIATWKQDVSAAFNARDDLVASSIDGGKTWQRSTIPGLTRCTGGTGHRQRPMGLGRRGRHGLLRRTVGLDLDRSPPAHRDRREPLGGRRPRLGDADHGCPPSRGQ